MKKISDEELSAGLRRRKPASMIEDEVRGTIVGQMVTDASKIPIHLINQSPYQIPYADESYIEELMGSITDTGGVISPVVVRTISSGKYELIAGHTRLEACRRLGLTEVSAVVRVMSDGEAAKALIADNLARRDKIGRAHV